MSGGLSDNPDDPREFEALASQAQSLRDLVTWASGVLSRTGVGSARVDAELLLAHILDVDRSELLRRTLMGVSPWESQEQAAAFAFALAQRAQRVPLQHLTGSAPFRHLELHVGPGVFIPRPETEIVAQVAIDELHARLQLDDRVLPLNASVAKEYPSGRIAVDLCTGSGAIALAMATEIPGVSVYAVELSHDAFAFTQRNNEKYGSLVHLVRADARTALQDLNGTVDVVVSNPPYVPPGAIPKDQEVAEHDPELALYGLGEDGLEVPRGITKAAARLLKPGGLFVMEHAEVQDAQARGMLATTQYFDRIETRVDLTNRPRMVVAYRNDVAYLEGSLS